MALSWAFTAVSWHFIDSMGFYGIPWAFTGFHGGFMGIHWLSWAFVALPWTFMGFYRTCMRFRGSFMGSHGLSLHFDGFRGLPRARSWHLHVISLFHGTATTLSWAFTALAFMEVSVFMGLHGFHEISWGFMVFHGTLMGFHGCS